MPCAPGFGKAAAPVASDSELHRDWEERRGACRDRPSHARCCSAEWPLCGLHRLPAHCSPRQLTSHIGGAASGCIEDISDWIIIVGTLMDTSCYYTRNRHQHLSWNPLTDCSGALTKYEGRRELMRG